MNDKIKAAILRELKSVEDIAAKAEAENRPLTADEQGIVAKHFEAAVQLRASAKTTDDVRQQLADLGGIDNGDPDEKEAPSGFYVPKRGESLGKAFVGSPEFKAMLGSVPNGRFGEKARVQSQPFGVKSLITGVSDTSAGAFITPDQYGFLDPTYQRPLTLRQLVTNGTTQTDTVEFVRLTGVTNNAGTVAEATSSAAPTQSASTGPLVNNAGGGYKPESAMAFARDSTTVKTIAHWIPATKRSLSDAGQVQTLVDAFLLYGLEEELEDQIMSGNGTGENFLGLSGTSGVQTQAAPTGDLTNMDVLRMARRKVRIGGRAIPTAYALNPIDWEGIELAKDGNDRYYGAGPFAMTTPTLWGLPVVESEAVPAGTAYVGDWRQAILWDREQSSIQATDSHADFFVRNLVAILAEMRAAFAVLRPAAFVKVTLA
jgi:HK97 family phage major capsid protein